MKTTFIYELVDPRTGETRYIGKTNNPEIRKKGHKHEKNTYKANWVKGLRMAGYEPILNVLQEVPFSDWSSWEQFYIKLYKLLDCPLTNLANGGLGVGMHSEETKRKMGLARKGKKLLTLEERYGVKDAEKRRKLASERGKGSLNPHFGKKHSEEVKKKISKANKGKESSFKGKTHTEETKKKMSLKKKGKPNLFLKGKPLPEETKRKISETNKGRKLSQERKALISIASKKVWNNPGYKEKMSKKRIATGNANYKGLILQYTKDNVLVKEWEGLHEIKEKTNFSIGNISSVLTGKLKTASGFKWCRNTDITFRASVDF